MALVDGLKSVNPTARLAIYLSLGVARQVIHGAAGRTHRRLGAQRNARGPTDVTLTH